MFLIPSVLVFLIFSSTYDCSNISSFSSTNTSLKTEGRNSSLTTSTLHQTSNKYTPFYKNYSQHLRKKNKMNIFTIRSYKNHLQRNKTNKQYLMRFLRKSQKKNGYSHLHASIRNRNKRITQGFATPRRLNRKNIARRRKLCREMLANLRLKHNSNKALLNITENHTPKKIYCTKIKRPKKKQSPKLGKKSILKDFLSYNRQKKKNAKLSGHKRRQILAQNLSQGLNDQNFNQAMQRLYSKKVSRRSFEKRKSGKFKNNLMKNDIDFANTHLRHKINNDVDRLNSDIERRGYNTYDEDKNVFGSLKKKKKYKLAQKNLNTQTPKSENGMSLREFKNNKSNSEEKNFSGSNKNYQNIYPLETNFDDHLKSNNYIDSNDIANEITEKNLAYRSNLKRTKSYNYNDKKKEKRFKEYRLKNNRYIDQKNKMKSYKRYKNFKKYFNNKRPYHNAGFLNSLKHLKVSSSTTIDTQLDNIKSETCNVQTSIQRIKEPGCRSTRIKTK